MHKKLFYFRTGFLGLNTILAIYCLVRGVNYNIVLSGYFVLLLILLWVLTGLEWKKKKKELMHDMKFHIASLLTHTSLFLVLVRSVMDQNILSTYILENRGFRTHGINVMYLNSNFIYLDILLMCLILYGCLKGKVKKQN